MKLQDDCKGCSALGKHVIIKPCAYIGNDKSEYCPCLVCIVKITCKKACSIFDDKFEKNVR